MKAAALIGTLSVSLYTILLLAYTTSLRNSVRRHAPHGASGNSFSESYAI